MHEDPDLRTVVGQRQAREAADRLPPATLIVVEVIGPEHNDAVARKIARLDGVVSATPAYADGFGRIVQIPLQTVMR